MLLTPGQTEERIWHYVRANPSLHATAADVARAAGADADEARQVLDELVARNLLRRFDTPGEAPIYWT